MYRYDYSTIRSSIEKTLDFAHVEYQDDGINALQDQWNDNKNALIDLLAQHPNWNSDLMAIVTKLEIEAQPNYEEAWETANELRRYAADKLIIDTWKVPNFECFFSYEATNKTCEDACHNLKLGYNIDVPVGQKITRAIRKILKDIDFDVDAYEESRKYFNKIGELITTRKLKRHAILSVNPADMLTMSYGTTWASCHIINPEITLNGEDYSGIYKAGCISYLLDGCTVIFYTLENLPEDLKDLPITPRETRQLFMIDASTGSFLQSRLYPYVNNESMRKSYRELVESIIATCMSKPNKWIVKDFSPGDASSEGLHYQDYNYSHYNPKWVRFEDEDRGCSLRIGRKPVCLKCGETRYDDEAGKLTCSDCEGYYCEHCGSWVREHEGRWIDDNFYCEGCIEQCTECGGWFVRDDMIQIANGDYVCEGCYEDEYVTCEDCGDVIRASDAAYDEEACAHYCPDCAEEYGFVRCAVCGTMMRKEDAHEDVNGRFYCAWHLTHRLVYIPARGYRERNDRNVFWENGTWNLRDRVFEEAM